MLKNRCYILLFLLIVFILATVVGWTSSTPAVFAVSTGEKNFDNTSVESDLADLDIERIKAEYNDMAIIEFVEYCYSDNVFRQGNYGLYLYVYNPERKELSMRDGVNFVNMAVSYNDKGEPSNFENRSLQYLGRTSGEYEKLFYKFKVKDAAEFLPVQKEYSKSYGKRRYDLAGLQLRIMGEAASSDYGVSCTYAYTGYAKGYGTDETVESTLKCAVTELETLRLDVKSVYYRPGGFNGENTRNQDQLNSVYFSVPNSVLSKYGSITEIHSEWYEYRTKPIFVTGNKNVYDGLKSYTGRDISFIYDSGKTFSSAVKYGFAAGYGSDHNGTEYADYGYNLSDYYPEGSLAHPNGKRLTQLDWLFYVNGNVDDLSVSSEELLTYARTQSVGKTDLIVDKYSRSLFIEDVGTNRTAGYNNVHIGADTKYDLRNYNIGSSLWDRLFGNYTSSFAEAKAIEAVTSVPMKADSGKLYIDDVFMNDFISYVQTAQKKDETVYLFRFALTDYYSVQAYNVENTKALFGIDVTSELDKNAYLAFENVFLDFDIIDVTFCRDGVYTVIPAVSSPIDVISDIAPPPDFDPVDDGLPLWAIILIIAVAVIILLPVVIALLPYLLKLVIWLLKWIIKAVVWIITAPFKFVAWLVNRIRNREK